MKVLKTPLAQSSVKPDINIRTIGLAWVRLSLLVGTILILVGLVASSSSLTSSASSIGKGYIDQSPSVSVNTTGSVDSRLDAAHGLRSLRPTSYTSLLPVPQSSPEILATYASDCTTPKTVFNVGDTICAKVTDVLSLPRTLLWATDSTIIHSSSITSSTHTDSFVINATSTVNGKTIDNRGTWQLVILNPFFFFPEIVATFTVIDPANATADLGVTTIGGSSAVQAGSQAVFQLQVNNYGPDSSANVVLTDAIPAGTTFVSFQQLTGPVFSCNNPGANSTSGSSVCSIASLDKGDNATFVATYDVSGIASEGDDISNTASIAGLNNDNVNGTDDQGTLNNSTTSTTTVTASPCVLTCPSDIIQDVDPAQAGAIVNYPATTGTSNCGSANDITSSPASASFFPVGTSAVTSTSAAGGGVCTFLVIINNPGNLSISLNGANPMALECGDDFADPGALAVNGIGQSVPVEVTLPQGFNPDGPAVGSYTITYTAAEGQNTVSNSRTVNVSDSSGPQVTLEGPNSITFSCGQGFIDPGVSAVDACEGSKTVSSSVSFLVNNDPNQPQPVGSVDTNTPGTYIITYTATDSGNRAGTAKRTVIVESGGGSAPPTITLNGSTQMTAECGAFTDPGATAVVPCGVPAPVSASTIDSHTPGTYTITYTACVEDTPGHCDPARTSQVERTVTIEDNTAPTITVDGANPTTVECHTSFTDPGATAHDACAGDFTATASGSVDPNTVGQYIITYNATDPSGHSAAPVTRTVNVLDATAPTVAAPPNVSVNTGSAATSCGAMISDATLGTASANDSCAGSLSVTRTGVPAGNVFPVGQTTITYSANDGHNTGTATQTVTVIDNTAPVISCSVNITLEPTCPSGAIATYTAPVGTDNCAGATTTRTAGQSSGSVFPIGTTTVAHTVTDASGNTASCSFTVTVLKPEAVIQTLMNSVSSSSLTGTQKNGLLAKLNAALDGLNGGQTNVACNKLDAFINSVQTLVSHGDITSAQGTSWINSANHVRNTIGCTNLGCS